MAVVVRTPFVIAACIGFLVGVGIASFAYTASYVPAWMFTAMVVGCVAVAVWRFGHRHRAIVCCGIIAIGLGVIRFTMLAGAPAIAAGVPSSDRTIEGRVAAVMPLTQGRARVEMVDARAVALRRDDPPETRFRRPITMFIPAASTGAVGYGDIVQVRCRLTLPQRFGDRLTIDGVCSARNPGDIQVLATGGGSPTFRLLARTRRELSARIDRSLAQPASGVVQSMVLG
ncbi:MAG: hypothetical protein Q7S02_04090, partial [bacterium]|nr:hypothetical protein [bacterium]